MKLYSLLPLLVFSLPPAFAFRVIVQPKTTIGSPTTVIWVKNATDPSPLTNLRFVINVDGKDTPLNRTNTGVKIDVDAGAKSLGKEMVTFSTPGQFTVKAVYGQDDHVLGTSNQVVVSPPGGLAPSPSATPMSAVASPFTTRASNKTPLLVGAILGAFLFIAILVALVRFLLHRRRLQREDSRISFHPDQMVQRRRSLWMDASRRGDGAEGGAPTTVPPPANPFEGGVDYNIDVEAARGDQELSSLPPGAAPPMMAAKNPFRDPSPPPSPAVPSNTKHVLASPAYVPSEYRPPKTSVPARARRPRPTPIHTPAKGHLLLPPSRALPQVPLSAPVHQSQFSHEIPPSPLTPSRSKPQRLMDRRLEQVQSQLDILRRRQKDGPGIDPEVAKKVEGDLERKAEWLRREIVKGWASGVEEDDENGVVPGGKDLR